MRIVGNFSIHADPFAPPHENRLEKIRLEEDQLEKDEPASPARVGVGISNGNLVCCCQCGDSNSPRLNTRREGLRVKSKLRSLRQVQAWCGCACEATMAAHPTLSEKTSSQFAANVRAFERICQVIVLLMGARCAFAGRNLPVGADGVAYLDVARSYLRHDWHTAVNGYWGPLYSWLLAIGMWFSHPGIRAEFAMARMLNFALFTAAVFTFSWFWRALADWVSGSATTRTQFLMPIPWSGLGSDICCSS